MFGIGLPEMILILALALIVVGPDKLPDLARSLAKGILELKNTAQTLKNTIASESPVLKEIQPELEDAAKSIKDHLVDSFEEVKKEDIAGNILDPLKDNNYDGEDKAEDIISDETFNKEDDSEADSSIEEGDSNQIIADADNAVEPNDDLTKYATDKEPKS